MVAAAQESKRLGLCQKSLFVVPNHLTEQWASEYLQLYPSANILVATKKNFETKNRKKFWGRIATGDYDAVIIGHSQFEKIPMSLDRQRAILQQQLDEVLDGISELKKNRGDNFSIKQLERTKKTVKQKLDKLNDQSRKDDVVTFEQLGVDRLYVDEAHSFKNCAKRCATSSSCQLPQKGAIRLHLAIRKYRRELKSQIQGRNSPAVQNQYRKRSNDRTRQVKVGDSTRANTPLCVTSL